MNSRKANLRYNISLKLDTTITKDLSSKIESHQQHELMILHHQVTWHDHVLDP